MVNLYTVVDAANLSQIRVRRDYKDPWEPEVQDVVFLNEEPVARVAIVTDLSDNLFDVTLDRKVYILIGNLVGIGIP
jgi:hypothetical protein